MSDQPTCGAGLAANAALPAKLAELIGSVARVLETHTRALDLEDDFARQEYDAYVELVAQHRGTARKIEALAEQMASYRDLPMGRHDVEVMTSPEAAQALERLVNVEQDLSSLLDERLEEHRLILGELRSSSR